MHLMDTYTRFPLKIVRGKGTWVWDEKGNRYLDAVAGIATCSLGHSHNSLRQALTKQLNKIQHVSNLYQISEQEELAKWLTEHSCADKAFFCNSGAEANEAAIKLARKFGHNVRKIEKPVILSARSSFHGRTLAAISATGQPIYHKGFEPLVEGFNFFEFNNINSFKNLLSKVEDNGPSVSAVIIEPLQGEGGVIPGDLNFFKVIRDICTEKNILLILDEVQTGMGRTGSWWGYEQLDIEPDAFTIAKGLGGGHAIGALLVKEQANVFKPGDHASTFGGNPFACKAGLTVAREIEKRGLLQSVVKREIELNEGLQNLVKNYPHLLKEVRGKGLLQGLVIHKDIELVAKDIVNLALEENLLLTQAGSKVIRMLPPLNISKKEVKQLINRLNATFEHLE